MADAKLFLVVDDDADDRDFFREALSEINPTTECREAIDGVDALEKLRIESDRLPDYIFLDLNMPRMDGRSLLLELKKDSLLKQIPVIILTTSSDPLDKEETIQLGATSFITKPYGFNELGKKIISVLELSYSGQD